MSYIQLIKINTVTKLALEFAINLDIILRNNV